MFSINELTAGQFIEIENIFIKINDEETQQSEKDILASNFLILLLGEEKLLQITQNEVVEVTTLYIEEVAKLKSNYDWIYNRPALPTSENHASENTIGAQYRSEFAEQYGGYTELIYLIATTFSQSPQDIWNWNVIDYLFWGNYLTHKRIVENIK